MQQPLGVSHGIPNSQVDDDDPERDMSLLEQLQQVPAGWESATSWDTTNGKNTLATFWLSETWYLAFEFASYDIIPLVDLSDQLWTAFWHLSHNVTGDIWRWRHGRTITPGSKLRKATELGVPRTSRHAESSCRCYCRISGEFWFPTWTYYWIIFIFYIHIYWFILYSYYVYLANLANLVPLGSFYLTCSSLHGLTD